MNKHTPTLQGFDSRRLQRIDEVIARNYVETGAIPGAQITIWRRGELVWRSTSGMIDIARGLPVREDSIFRLYSMTKPITAVALLMLMEEGQIALDDLVSRHIPGFADLGIYAGGSMGDFRTTPNPRPMKVVDLLRHTSGLTYGFLNRTEVDAGYRKLKMAEAGQEGGLPGMIAALEKLPLEFAPGTMWNYSVSTDVVGWLVEKISGQRFSDFLRTRILTPLQMHDTDFTVPPSKRDRFATCYYVREGKLLVFDDAQNSIYAQPPLLESGGGGLAGTAKDYLRFCRMLLNGGELDGARLLSPKTVALMTMNHLPGGRTMTEMMPVTEAFSESGYAGVGYGLGVGVTQDVAASGIPGTVGEYSWGGAAGTYFFNDPKEDLAVVFMTQVLFAADRIKLRRDLRSLVYGAMTESYAGSGRLMIREEFDITQWHGPFEAQTRARAQTALEHGKLLYFPKMPFQLSNSETEFLDGRLTDGKAKNISLDHTSGKLQGTSATGERATRLAAMIERFGAGATRFVQDLLPNYSSVERARTSYRPVEVEGRPYSVIQDDRLLHVDAFPSRPMKNGRRILRFFANVAPRAPNGIGARKWEVGEPFADFAGKFAPQIKPHFPGKSWAYEKLGVTKGKRSAYDEMMLSLHDAAKRDARYQKTAPHTALEFPPGSCWLVYTDQVLHAALKGEFALEQTFHFDVAQMGEPDTAPIKVLERITGKALA